MRNVKLAVKIGGGFGLIIVIFLILGGINGWYMLDIRDGAQDLNNKYIPEVRLMEDFKADYAKARIDFSKYIFTFEKKYYEAGMEDLRNSRSALKKLGELAESYPALSALRKNRETISKSINAYDQSMKALHKIGQEFHGLHDRMDQAAGSLEKNVEQFLETHKKHVREGGNAGLREIYLMNEVMDLNDGIRVANFKSVARNDMSFARSALEDFDKIYSKLDKIEEETGDKKTMAQLQNIRTALGDYKQAMVSILEAHKKVDSELAKLVEIGENLLDKTATVAQKGMERTVEVGQSNVDNVESSIFFFAVGLLITLILGAFIAVVLTLSVTRPIFKGVNFAKRLAEGDFSQELDISQKDEVGVLAQSLNEMVRSNARMFKDVSSGVETLASSSTELNTISEDVSSRAEDTASKSNSVATSAEEMSTNMNSIASAMEQASTNVSTVASSSEEMSTTISEIAENSERAKSITGDAVQKSQETSQRVDELGKAASEISKVTESITAISSQTNLLALNATIEAARAGEAGKGFAVVANEIKELAQQTASATGEIKERIQAIQNATDTTVSEIGEISQVINDIDSIISTIATAVEEQSTTTKDIAENVGQASQGIQEVNENVSQSSSVAGEISRDINEVNNSASEMSNSSAQVKQSAEELSKLSEKLKNLVAHFKV